MAINLLRQLICSTALCMVLVPNSRAGSCDTILNEDASNECLADELSANDKKLNNAYVQSRERIGDLERELLKQGESAWIKSRDGDCAFEAQSVSGGTAYRAVYLSCRIPQTKARTKKITDWEKIIQEAVIATFLVSRLTF